MRKKFYFDIQKVNENFAVLYLTEHTAYWQDRDYNFRSFSFESFFKAVQNFNLIHLNLTVYVGVSCGSLRFLLSLPAYKYAYIKLLIGSKTNYSDEKKETFSRFTGT